MAAMNVLRLGALRRLCAATGAAVVLAVVSPSLADAATRIVIVNGDQPGEGFNDTTPVDPVGGNNGTTLGEQRMNLFQAVAEKWGSKLDSDHPVYVYATWPALDCDDSSAVLGAAGPAYLYLAPQDSNVPLPDHWYHSAVATKYGLSDSSPEQPDIMAYFNANLGQPGCLSGSGFYLGFDGKHGDSVDLYSVFLHELGHGLGFSTNTDDATGEEITDEEGVPHPSVWDHFLLDTTTNKLWDDMTDEERAASAVNTRHLVWTGPKAVNAVPSVLKGATPELDVFRPASLAGTYLVAPAAFGPEFSELGMFEQVAAVATSEGGGNACAALPSHEQWKVAGKIALIDRGGCAFTEKVKNAQDAGARAVLIADNVSGTPPAEIGGTDKSIEIPAGAISKEDGDLLHAQLNQPARGNGSKVFVWLRRNPFVLPGADLYTRPLLWTPNPNDPGSSVNHFDSIASPNQLMEAYINDDTPHEVAPPYDLTLPLLEDVGWTSTANCY